VHPPRVFDRSKYCGYAERTPNACIEAPPTGLRGHYPSKHWYPNLLSPIMTQARFSSTLPNPNAPQTPGKLTHIDNDGRPSMVDVSQKDTTHRSATARGRIYLPVAAYSLVAPLSGSPDIDVNAGSDTPSLAEAKAKASAKGDVLTVAQLAAIMACKRTSDLIPLCHPLSLTHVSVSLVPEVHAKGGDETPENEPSSRYSILCTATVRCRGQTGVEMEALTAVSVGLLTVWDMLKAVAGKEMMIGDVLVSHKSGGKSGEFVRQ